MREPEGGVLSRLFIGRHDEREDIKTRLVQDGGFLLLHGQPLVGKASLALQVAEELRSEQGNVPFSVYSVDCRDAADWSGMMHAICRAFSFDEAAANENLLAGAILQRLRERGGKLLLLLLRVHRMTPSGPDVQNMTRCLQTLASADVMTLVTSRRQLQLPVQKRVSPLTLGDAVQLLRHHAPDVTATEFQKVLHEHCYGLPPLVLQVARLVSGDPMLAFSATQLTEALQEDRGLLMNGLSEEARSFFSTLSRDVQDHVFSLAQLLDGSFSMEALRAVVGLEDRTGARTQMLVRRLHEEAPLVLDSQSQRMRIEPLVLHHVRKLGHVAADDPARLRVVTFLGRVLIQAERELYVEGQDTVYGHLHGDWPQLQHVLRQAIHCTSHTYQAYMQVALKADKLLAKCFPHDALGFYQNMATAAVHFGTARDQAILQGLIGMAVTQGQGTGWGDALCYFHRALPVLEQDPRSVSYLRLLIDVGVVYFRLNRLQEADRYLSQAVSVSERIDVEDDTELVFHLLRARNFLALPCIFRGHLTQSKTLLLETLELCEQLAPHHPDKAILINSLGLVYERSEEDQNVALHYYIQSLVERRRYAAVAPGDMVPSLNNVGMQYSRRGDYNTALKYLEEAALIRKQDNRWHYYTALTEQHIGQVAIQKGDYARAEHHLQEAAKVYSRCTPSHDVRAKVALCLAHLYITKRLCDVSRIRQYLKEVCELSDNIGDDLSDSGLVVLMTSVQHRVMVAGWVKAKVMPLLYKAQLRISRFDGDPSEKLTEHLSIISDMISMLQTGLSQVGKEALRSRVINQCQICQYLSINEDIQSLWREMETQQADRRELVTSLRTSLAIRNVLDLSRQHQPGAASLPEQTSRSVQTLPERQRVPQMSPCSGVMDSEPAHNQESPRGFFSSEGRLEQKWDSPDQLQQVVNRVLNWDVGREQDKAGEARTIESLPQHDSAWQRHVNSTRAVEMMSGLQTTVINQNDQTGVSQREILDQTQAAMLTECVAHQTVGVATQQEHHVMDRQHSSSCSFTSSDPPSTCSSEAMSISSRGSAEDGSRHQSERTTFCQRILEVFPQQETARDQSSDALDMFCGDPQRYGFADQSRGDGDDLLRYTHSQTQLLSSNPHSSSSDELACDRPHLATTHTSTAASLPPVPPAHASSPPVPQSVAAAKATLETVATCAQQLEAILPSTATSEQRTVLEKLAALVSPESGSSSSENRPLNTETSQPAKTLSTIHSIHPETVITSPHDQSQAAPDKQTSFERGPRLTQLTESASNLTAAQDQINAFRKVGLGAHQLKAAQSQLLLTSVSKETGGDIQHVMGHQTYDCGSNTQLRTSQGDEGIVSSSTDVSQTVHREKRASVTYMKDLTERPQSKSYARSSLSSAVVQSTTKSSTVSRESRPVMAGTLEKMEQSSPTMLGFSSTSQSEPSMIETFTDPTRRGAQRAVHPSSVSPAVLASSISFPTVLGVRGRREPTECEDTTELQPLSQTDRPLPHRQGAWPARREATENDERLDNPRHVCTSEDCGCSLRGDL